jgi:ATP-dependent DNA helicase RecG
VGEEEASLPGTLPEPTALLETDRGLADHPGLAMEVAALATDERAEYLEKA